MASTLIPAVPSPSTKDNYAYPRLPDFRSVRILTLKPATNESDPVEVTLSVEHLDNVLPEQPGAEAGLGQVTTSTSEYEAISYVWGTDGRSHTITCDGKHLPVTQSIYDALVRMRLPSEPRRLWADQVCIDQDNVAERSSQVRLMNAVYKGASRILVWLGRDEQGVAEDAIKMVDHLHGVFCDDDAHAEFRLAHSEQLYRQNYQPWIPLSKLTKLAWFGRIWIVQEIGTGAPATLFWGPSELDWHKLSVVAGILNQQYHYLRTRFHIGTSSIRYLYNRFVEPEEDFDEYHNRGSFVYELHRARHLLARDPRDHVYAFLGHFSLPKGSWALQDMEADYNRPVRDVFCDVAIRSLKGATSLILLSATHNVASGQRKPPGKLGTGDKEATTDLDLPTWVPDWRVLPLHMLGTPVTPHKAAGDTNPKLTIDEARHILQIEGVEVDTVSERSWVFYSRAFSFRQSRWAATSPVEALWRDICGFGLFDLDVKYPPFANTASNANATGTNASPSSSPPPSSSATSTNAAPPHESSAFFALIQTLTNACSGIDRSRPYESIPSKEWLANGAAYLMKSGVPRNRISPRLLGYARSGDAFKWSHEATLVTRYRRFAVTAGGYYVMGPDSMEDGDVIAVLDGGRTPFVIRRVHDKMDLSKRSDGSFETSNVGDDHGNVRTGRTANQWLLVGECYVHGLMNGEAASLPHVKRRVFSMI